ncbi:transcription regulator/ zinc ion binding protein [Wolffia australiana]
MGASGEWLEAALLDLAGRVQTGLQLDADVVSGLVSYCELAPPEDAREYLTNIVGPEASGDLIREYLQRRGFLDSSGDGAAAAEQPPALQRYVKPSAHDNYAQSKKPARPPAEKKAPSSRAPSGLGQGHKEEKSAEGPVTSSKGARRKKGGKVAVSLAEAARGAVVFKQGSPCDCQARRHGLVSNCLSCGKIVCEQEGEGPCGFCGALVLREGSTYAGLEGSLVPPPSAAEASAEAFTKRLVEYDRNSAARTTVIDDQSDYYEFEGNSWLSNQEREALARKLKEKEEEEERRRGKLVVTFDLLGRKVVAHEQGASELLSEQRILRPLENQRITPNPAATMRPVYVEAAAPPPAKTGRPRQRFSNGFCLEITGRVQHSSSDENAGLTPD